MTQKEAKKITRYLNIKLAMMTKSSAKVKLEFKKVYNYFRSDKPRRDKRNYLYSKSIELNNCVKDTIWNSYMRTEAGE